MVGTNENICMLREESQVVVLDFGGQYGHLISRRIRELGVYSLHVPVEIVERDMLDKFLKYVKGIVLSGGPSSVWERHHDKIVSHLLGKVNILGICYGHQLLAHVLGGKVEPSPKPEFGPTVVELLEGDSLFNDIPKRITVWMSHRDAVITVPPEIKILATSVGSPVAALKARINDKTVYGVQWHPEVIHSEYGKRLLQNWLKIIGATIDWDNPRLFQCIAEYVRSEIRDLPKNKPIISAISGGVDSTVATAIVASIAGDRLFGILIDHGLHPEGEIEFAVSELSKLGIKIKIADYSREFLERLKGVVDPEEKRRIISELYFDILTNIIREYNAVALVQGTIYPDIIESGALPGSARIKSHHNVVFREKLSNIKIIEPLRWLYKDEVRRLGEFLGISKRLLYKQPIPGPGLAVRIEGEVTREKIEIVRKADTIVRRIIEEYGLDKDLWQYFAILSASLSTGVKGDQRAYGHVVVLRIVESADAMTARPAHLPWRVLERIAGEITSNIDKVVRVVYDITSKPPATIEWE